MATIWLFVEGGQSQTLNPPPGENRFGKRNATDDFLIPKVLSAFRAFLKPVALSGCSLKITPLGGRQAVSNHFFAEVNQAKLNPEVVAYVLLVDTEKPLKKLSADTEGNIDYWKLVEDDTNLFTKVKAEADFDDIWSAFKRNATVSLCFMVAMMETWILADLSNIQTYFSLAALPPLKDGDDLENMEKNPIEHLFRDWAKNRYEVTDAGKSYTKTDGYNLLETANPIEARKLSQCERLFAELERIAAQP